MKLYLDYDSLLNDMSFSWIKWINDTYNTNFTQADVTSWQFYTELTKNSDEFAHVLPYDWFALGHPYRLDGEYSCKPLQGSQQFFNAVTDMYDTYILTSTHEDNKLIEDKNNHIYNYYSTEAIIHEHHKWKYATDNYFKPNILVDDRLANCLIWAAKGGIAILYNHNGQYEYNKMFTNMTNVHKAFSYEDVYNILLDIKYA